MRNDFFFSILIIYQFVVDITTAQCNGVVRLSGIGSNEWGSSDHYGFIEIYYNSRWGTICDDGIDNYNITHGVVDPFFTVVCRQLGYDTVIEGYSWPSANPWGYGTDDQPTWLDDVKCFGYESHPGKCWHRGWGNEGCGHHEDISVHCGGFTGDTLFGVSCTDHDDCCDDYACVNNVCSLEADLFVDILSGPDTYTLATQNTALINVVISEVSELNDKLDKLYKVLLADSIDSNDENANALMENHKMDNNDDAVESYQSINVEFTESTFVFVVVVSAFVIISVLICFYFYYNKK